MKAKEKAEDLVNKFRPMMYCYIGSEMLTNTFNENEQIRNAKQCALIVVDEKIKQMKRIDLLISNSTYMQGEYKKEMEHLNEVKQEIEKL